MASLPGRDASCEIDLAPVRKGPVFEPLRDPDVFSGFQIRTSADTLRMKVGVPIRITVLRCLTKKYGAEGTLRP